MNIKHDILDLLSYIEPDISNFPVYSIKILSLLTQTCIAMESLFKSILKANKFQLSNREKMDIKIYSRLDKTHKLSDFSVGISLVLDHIFEPFISFSNSDINKISPVFYHAYNASKHNSFGSFKRASFENLLNAFAGLFVLHVSVSGIGFDTDPAAILPKIREIDVDGIKVKIDSYESKTNSFFNLVGTPSWSDDQRYDVDWGSITDKSSYKNLDI